MPRNPRLRIAPGGVEAELARERAALAQVPLPYLGPDDGEDEEEARREAFRRRLEPRTMPGTRPSGKKVKWCHVVRGMPCHAFTVPRRTHDAVGAGEPLTCDGAVYPDGQPVVPPGVAAWNVPLRCGTCGTTSITAEDLVFILA